MPAPASKLDEYRRPEVAAAYDRRWSGAAGARRNRRKARAIAAGLSRLGLHAGTPLRLVLDAPCGNGRFTAQLRARGHQYLGLDRAPAMLQAAAARFPDARFLAGDLARLPFPSAAFDAALCIRFLHLVRDGEQRVAFLRELARVARYGVLLDYRHDRTLRVWSRRARHRLGLLVRPPANPSPARIRAEVAAAGLHWLDAIAVHRAPLLSDKILVIAAVPR